MRFRDADKADLPFITEVYNEAVLSRISTADTILQDLSVFENRLVDPNPRRPLWIAEEGGQSIGWVSFRDFYGRPAYGGTAELSIYIHSQFRNKGFGSIIIQKVIDLSPSLDIHTLLGFIFKANEASIQLVKKAGFEEWGMLPSVAMIDGKWHSLVIVGKKVISQ